LQKAALQFLKLKNGQKKENEFEKRAAFATLAAYCMADKKADNQVFEQFLPMLIRDAVDARLYVRKALNWALRNIGKRNVDLHKKAIETAKQIIKLNTKSSLWIGNDAISQLTKLKVNRLDYPRAIYRIEATK
jgi:3-methyladenine DNA glycosylase AlkD